MQAHDFTSDAGCCTGQAAASAFANRTSGVSSSSRRLPTPMPMMSRRPVRVFLWQFLALTEAAMVAHWAFREPPISPGDAGLCIAFAAVVGLATFQCVAAVLGSPAHLIAAAITALLAVAVYDARISHSDAVRWNARIAKLRREVAAHCPTARQDRVQVIVARWAASPRAT